MPAGCLLWNIVVDRLLTVTNDLGFSTFGYADDIVIIVQGKSAHIVREFMQSRAGSWNT